MAATHATVQLNEGAKESEGSRESIVYELLGEMAPGAALALHPGTDLTADLGYDSLDLLELITAIEERFDLAPFSEEDLGALTNVSDLLRLVDAAAEADRAGASQ